MYNLGYNSGTAGYATPWSSSYNASNSGYTSQAGCASGSYDSLSNEKPIFYTPAEQHAAFIAETFLESERPLTPMISQLGQVKEVVEQTFKTITRQEFSYDSINIVICTSEQLKSIHGDMGNKWNDGIMGFSFNKYGKGISEIFVKQDHMDSLLLTIGHEIGHVLSRTLPNAKDEEAKAHAFSIAWMEAIRDNNIAGLKPNIRLNPARNGLHDVAYDFVQYLLKTGANAFDIFKTLAYGLTSMVGER